MANVRVDNLVKRYGTVTALNNVSVSIADGSLTAILGPSGCGKTTLLRCIAGLLLPDEGKIFIGTHDVTRVEPHHRNLGMVFQRPSMFPHMTVYQNIAWGLRLRRWPNADIPGRVKEMLRLVQLDGMDGRKYNQLSGGQAQRVVIARALAPKPDLLLLDEPLSALDAKLRGELLSELVDIQHKTGCTTLLVTHDQSEALSAADNLILMDNGNIMQEGHPLDVYRNPQNLFSASFIGTNNLLPCVVVGVNGHSAMVRLDDTDLELNAEVVAGSLAIGQPVRACIRADDIDIIPGEAAAHYQNVVTLTVERAMLTGGIVRVESRLGAHGMVIHVGGSQRFGVVEGENTRLTASLSRLTLIPYSPEDAIMPADSRNPSTNDHPDKQRSS